MQCKDIRRLESAYVDGELESEQTDAYRSHLRTCTACRQATTDLALLVDLTAQLEPVEPPARLWAAIKSELRTGAAQTSIQTSINSPEQQPSSPQAPARWLTAWLRPRFLLPVGAVAAAAALILVWSLGDEPDRRTQLAAAQPDAPTRELIAQRASESGHTTHTEALTGELRAADQQYASTIAELREMIDEERDTWTSATNTAYERRMNQFEAAASRHRQTLALASTAAPDPRGHDALYDVFRAEISFLQRVAIDGSPALPSPGGHR